VLELYRQALRIRRTGDETLGTAMTWLPVPPGVLAFDRGDGLRCLANPSSVPVVLPGRTTVLLASRPCTDGLLPPDTAVWLRTTQE
jgi:alpha-glucosidase